jgi:alginate O-acetyltransferase complex protein AlgI
VAGPILRYNDMAKQLIERKIEIGEFAYGVRRFIIGFAKKILIANIVGEAASNIFSIPGKELTAGLAWLGILCYTLQIFYDFSGYSDMAIGLGRMFGFKIPENFNYPYISQTIREFWRRWHISLSKWFRDYVYISLGGSRVKTVNVYRNLLIVFFLTGLWHGASWTFVIWGLYHGFFIVLERTRLGKLLEKVYSPFRHIYAILVVMIGWVLFRADTLGYALRFLIAMAGFGHGTGLVYNVRLYLNNEIVCALIAGILGSTPLVYLSINYMREKFDKRLHLLVAFDTFHLVCIYLIFFVSIMYMATSTYNPFIYFRF